MNRVIEILEFYSLQRDEFSRGCHVSQLFVFIRMVFIIGNMKE